MSPLFNQSTWQLPSTTSLPSSFPSSCCPPHPVRHGHRRVIVQKRAREGLFAGKHIQFGNSVSHSHHKTRRTWQPNVQYAVYRSDLLQSSFRLQVTTHAMRCIDKAGGFDSYLLFTPQHKLGPEDGFAMQTRRRLEVVYRPIRNRLEMEDRLRRKAERLEQERLQLTDGAQRLQLEASSAAMHSQLQRERVSVQRSES